MESEEQSRESDVHQKTEDELVAEFPGFPSFAVKKHCCCSMTYYPEINSYFWKEWEFQPCMPAFVLLLISSSYLIAMIFGMRYFGYECIFAVPFLTFSCLMFIISYIQIIRVGPGYFPFYWAVRNAFPKDENSDFLLSSHACPPNGILTTNSQYEWAHQLKRPERSVLARSARRIVLRPDHLCGWTTVWIGKRNHKFFMLFNFYGTLYMSVFAIYMSRALIKIFQRSQIPIIIVFAMYILFSLAFALMTLSFTISSLAGLYKNATSWEEWNNLETRYDRGSFIKNLEDVCGSSTKWMSWFCPVSPFDDYTNEELAEQYSIV